MTNTKQDRGHRKYTGACQTREQWERDGLAAWDLQVQTCVYGMDFPGGASGKEHACQHRRCQRPWFSPWLGRSPEGGHKV